MTATEKLDRRPVMSEEQLIEKVSAYKLTTWGRCQALFKYLYIDGLWGPPSPALVFGSAFDRAVSDGYKNKRQTDKDPGVKDSQEVFAATLEKEGEDVEDWEGEKIGDLKDEGARHVLYWAKHTAPEVIPYDVQHRFRLHVSDWKVDGVIDLTMQLTNQAERTAPYRGIFVVDHKTSGKAWSAAKANQQMQTVFYSLAAQAGQLVEGVDPSRIGYEIAVRNKVPRRQRFVVGVGQKQIHGLLNRIETARRGWVASYRSGAWYPNREHFLCSLRWCPHWKRCEAEHGGSVRD